MDARLAPVQSYAEGRAPVAGLVAENDDGIRPQSPWPGDVALPFAARWEPGALAPLERRRSGRGQAARLPYPLVDWLLRLPLVPCDGARVVRGHRNSEPDERVVRQH